jgi:mRNA interferase YafQ
MYCIEYTGGFLKQAKQCKKRGYNMALLERVIQLLAETGKLTTEYKSHKLAGNMPVAGNATLNQTGC